MEVIDDHFVQEKGDKKNKNHDKAAGAEDHRSFGVIKVEHAVNGGYNQDLPSDDDVCPICFDSFSLPCRSNCGHWFCANCILQYWMFKSAIRPCKCPMCACKITNLKQADFSPYGRQQDYYGGGGGGGGGGGDDVVEVTKRIHNYNAMFGGGVYSGFQRALALPLYTGAIFRAVIEPDGLRCVYYVTRLLGGDLGFKRRSI